MSLCVCVCMTRQLKSRRLFRTISYFFLTRSLFLSPRCVIPFGGAKWCFDIIIWACICSAKQCFCVRVHFKLCSIVSPIVLLLKHEISIKPMMMMKMMIIIMILMFWSQEPHRIHSQLSIDVRNMEFLSLSLYRHTNFILFTFTTDTSVNKMSILVCSVDGLMEKMSTNTRSILFAFLSLFLVLLAHQEKLCYLILSK